MDHPRTRQTLFAWLYPSSPTRDQGTRSLQKEISITEDLNLRKWLIINDICYVSNEYAFDFCLVCIHGDIYYFNFNKISNPFLCKRCSEARQAHHVVLACYTRHTSAACIIRCCPMMCVMSVRWHVTMLAGSSDNAPFVLGQILLWDSFFAI